MDYNTPSDRDREIPLMQTRSASSARRSRKSRAATTSTRKKDKKSSSSTEDECPFCTIARQNPPKATITPYVAPSTSTPTHTPNATHMVLSTPQVIGFLDIMPLSVGHVLLTPRHHAEKIMDLTPEEGASLGAWLPIVTRAVSRAMQVDDLNVVQNNGMDSESPEECRVNVEVGWGRKVFEKVEEVFNPAAAAAAAGSRASQVVKHVHYHIIPRPESYTPSKSWTMFGKGPRSDLDDDEAALVAARIRQEIAWEMERMGNSQDPPVVRTNFLAPKL
ncbi:hypothetical protein DRE_02163 [Drechslerella stenobrocha 248]|uniref:HIT domain-containing protein n=1 Tax=Drechslerella stenobrocha 248 TaxID=1043628 RepID=W7HXZ9_9PEZI|nr:hypothetical protein DRE_02163 [Drechslerella stenobrocha 248]